MSLFYLLGIITYLTLWLKVIFGFFYWSKGLIKPKIFFKSLPSSEDLVTLKWILISLLTRAFGLFVPAFLFIAQKSSVNDLGALSAMSVYGILFYVPIAIGMQELREDCKTLGKHCNEFVKYFKYGPWGLVGTYRALVKKGN